MRFTTMPAMGKSSTLVLDEQKGEVVREVTGPNHAAEAERTARDLNLLNEIDDDDFDPWPIDIGCPVG